jgi:hypothetical protein
MSDQITYGYFCTLGGLTHPRTWTKAVYLGGRYMHTEYYLTRKDNS